MNKDPQTFLRHILESIDWIEKDVKGMSRKEFLTNVPTQDAVIRRIEIIGEAIRNLPEELRSKHSEVPWQDIMGMRNQLIHGYFGVDLELVWRVIENDIPPLKRQVKKLIDKPVQS